MAMLREEKGLAIFYPLIIALSLICSISSAIAWTHWKYVLDICDKINCGCFLYSLSAISFYQGGHVAYCHLAVYGLVFPVIFAVIFGSFHVYRVCMGTGRPKTGTTTIRKRAGETIVITAESEINNNDISPYYWIPASVISILMTIYCIAYAAIFTDGLFKTCNQYRLELSRYMQATGNLVAAIQGRISCTSVFDFMDYIHADAGIERRRHDRINSPACFYLTLVCGWTIVIIWLLVSCMNIYFARKSRSVRV